MSEKEREYYRFLLENTLRGLVWLAAIIALYVLGKALLGDVIKGWITPVSDQPFWVLAIFFLSETLFGIIPAEFFMIWATQHPVSTFWGLLTLLACLSLLAGMLAYQLGIWATRIPWLKRTLQRETFVEYARLYRKFGGVVIIISALTPLPFGAISMVSASLGFPFGTYVFYASFRFLRFAALGWFLWEIGI